MDLPRDYVAGLLTELCDEPMDIVLSLAAVDRGDCDAAVGQWGEAAYCSLSRRISDGIWGYATLIVADTVCLEEGRKRKCEFWRDEEIKGDRGGGHRREREEKEKREGGREGKSEL